MERLKCAVKNCERNALVRYGDNWICGECMVKINNAKNKLFNREVEELGNAN